MSGQAVEPTGLASKSRLLSPPHPVSTPVIICFHGSGESCSPSWDVLASELSRTYRVLVLDRGSRSPSPSKYIPELSNVLLDISPPFVLVAHSYGGAFARYFLQERSKDVAGMVMVETGQETALDPEVERGQYSRQVLGSKPLSVIRGNSFIAKFKTLEALGGDSQLQQTQRRLLEQWSAEDERLKKAQLALSRNRHYIHLPDCGHHVVRDRPDAVIKEVSWVMQNLDSSENNQVRDNPQSAALSLWATWRRFLTLGKG